jgi:hypothetical protein
MPLAHNPRRASRFEVKQSRAAALSVLVGAALVIQPHLAVSQAATDDVAAIRARYGAINRDLPRYAVATLRLNDYAAEGADITAHFEGDELKKLVISYLAETDPGKEEYYFAQGSPFFIFRYKRRAADGNSSRNEVDENRFYFAAGRLIRWIDENGRLLVIDQPEARREQNHLLSEARILASLISGAPRAIPALSASKPKDGSGTDAAREIQNRIQLAARHQQTMRAEGCADCTVWVSGSGNRTLNIIDPQAPAGNNDYLSAPILWFGAGFTEVIYYSKRGKVYAKHRK